MKTVKQRENSEHLKNLLNKNYVSSRGRVERAGLV